MVFFTNWDLLDLQNKVVRVSDNGEVEHQYIISDLGATFGKLGNNNLPFFFRLGRKTNQPDTWNEAGFVSGVKEGKIDFDFKGKGRGLMDDITIAQGRWLADLLLQLSDKQIEDAFRAAGYGDADVVTLKDGFKDRVSVLDHATNNPRRPPSVRTGSSSDRVLFTTETRSHRSRYRLTFGDIISANQLPTEVYYGSDHSGQNRTQIYRLWRIPQRQQLHAQDLGD